MKVRVAFHKEGAELNLPDCWRTSVLEPRFAAAAGSAADALQRALADPIASPPLLDLARGKSSAAIAVCDITRPAPNRVVLP